MKRPVAIWTRYDDGTIDYCLVQPEKKYGATIKKRNRLLFCRSCLLLRKIKTYTKVVVRLVKQKAPREPLPRAS